MGFRFVIRCIEQLKIVTRRKDQTVTDLHTLQITRRHDRNSESVET
jgi:hypothetical protein